MNYPDLLHFPPFFLLDSLVLAVMAPLGAKENNHHHQHDRQEDVRSHDAYLFWCEWGIDITNADEKLI